MPVNFSSITSSAGTVSQCLVCFFFKRHHSGSQTNTSHSKGFRILLCSLPIRCFWAEKPKFYSWGHKSSETFKALNARVENPPFQCTGSRVQLFLNFQLALRTHPLNINLIRLLFDAYWVYWSLPAYPCWLIVFAARDETLISGYWNSARNQQWQEPRTVSTEVTITLRSNIVYAYSLMPLDSLTRSTDFCWIEMPVKFSSSPYFG